jgi:hypothetical protein
MGGRPIIQCRAKSRAILEAKAIVFVVNVKSVVRRRKNPQTTGTMLSSRQDFRFFDLDLLSSLSQAGIPRTKEKVVAELEKQVKLACAGVQKHVKESQTETGVKDAYTQHWIDDLLARFKEMRTNQPDRSEQDIQAELVQWTFDNRDKIYSAFLTTDGELHSSGR